MIYMFCVNVVHSQIVTVWAIILQNAGLKFNIKIQMPYFHNIHKYCGNTASGLATYAA